MRMDMLPLQRAIIVSVVLAILSVVAVPGCASVSRVPDSRFAYTHPSIKWVCRFDASALVLEHFLYIPGCVFPMIGTGSHIAGACVENDSVLATVYSSGGSCSGKVLGSSAYKFVLDLQTGKRAAVPATMARRDRDVIPPFKLVADVRDLSIVRTDMPEQTQTPVIRTSPHMGFGTVWETKPVAGSTVEAMVFVVGSDHLVCVDGRKLVSSQ